MSYTINHTQDGVVQYPMHTHKKYEIMLYLDGEGYMRTELGNIPFETGTIVIVPPNIKHGSISENGFRNISIEGDFEAYFRFDTVKSFEDNESQEGKTLTEMIYENRYGNKNFLEALCTAYLCFLLQRFEIENTIDRVIKNIISEISEHALDPVINLTEILQKSGYSEDYIRSVFKKLTGKTPHEFLTDIRMNHACFLIDVYKDTLLLSQIAEKCGYLDYVYFSKIFKSVKGVSPKSYREL